MILGDFRLMVLPFVYQTGYLGEASLDVEYIMGGTCGMLSQSGLVVSTDFACSGSESINMGVVAP